MDINIKFGTQLAYIFGFDFQVVSQAKLFRKIYILYKCSVHLLKLFIELYSSLTVCIDCYSNYSDYVKT